MIPMEIPRPPSTSFLNRPDTDMGSCQPQTNLNAGMALPKDIYSPARQILLFAKCSQSVMNTHTPTHTMDEARAISVKKDKFSPRRTRSKTSQVKLFSQSQDGKVDVLLIIHSDGTNSHSDCQLVISQTFIQQHHTFFVWNGTNSHRSDSSFGEHGADSDICKVFSVDSISSLLMHSSQAALCK